MAKRYHNSKHVGDGMDARRRKELEDPAFVTEDYNAPSNLPQHVVMRPYPKANYYLNEGLDDTLSGIDRQMEGDYSQMRKHLKPKKV
jgi:hypothetical protein